MLIACFLSSQIPSGACLWDRDTLAYEAGGHSELLNVISGRFPRNPPVFYEARLTRVGKELLTDPDNLALYDDAGVACDQLNRHEDAIDWMEKKAAVLKAHPDSEHQYRYHANLGTFLIHKWLAEGANADQPEGKSGAEHIRKAIEINPDAHFGRERVQLDAIEWIIEERSGIEVDPQGDQSPTNIFRSIQQIDSFPYDTNLDKMLEGLSGLVVLGAAWESVDVFEAIAVGLRDRRKNSFSRLASLRVEELIADGKQSFARDFDYPYSPKAAGLDRTRHIDKWYRKAREAANQWHEARTAYMEKEIREGKHPDTHPNFWDGFDSEQHALPKLPDTHATKGGGAFYWVRILLWWTFIALLAVVVLRILKKVIHARRGAPST